MIFQISNTTLLLLLSSPSLLLAQKPSQSLHQPALHHFHLSKIAGSKQRAGFDENSLSFSLPLDHSWFTNNTTDLQNMTTEQQTVETSLLLHTMSPECYKDLFSSATAEFWQAHCGLSLTPAPVIPNGNGQPALTRAGLRHQHQAKPTSPLLSETQVANMSNKIRILLYVVI